VVKVRKSVNFILGLFDTSWCLYVIIGAGLLLRLAVLRALSAMPLLSDAAWYHQMALQLLHGEKFSPYWPPGLPYYLSFCYRIFGESEFVARAAMLVFYIILVIIIFSFTKKMANRGAANVAVLIISLYPTFIHQSVEPFTQLPVAVCLLSLVFLATMFDKQKSLTVALVTGLILGAAVLLRASNVVFLIVVPIFYLFRIKRITPALISLLTAMVIISAWLVKAYDMTGRFIPINNANAMNFFLGNNEYTPLYKTWWFGSHKAGEANVPDAFVEVYDSIKAEPETERDRLYTEAAWKHIRSRPVPFVLRTLNRMRVYFAFDTFSGSMLMHDYHLNRFLGLGVIALDAGFYCLIMLSAIFFLIGFRNSFDPVRFTWIAVATVIIYAVPYWISFAHPTYHFPVMPFFIVFTAIFWEQLGKFPHSFVLESIFSSRWRKYLLAFAILVFCYIQAEWVIVMSSRV